MAAAALDLVVRLRLCSGTGRWKGRMVLLFMPKRIDMLSVALQMGVFYAATAALSSALSLHKLLLDTSCCKLALPLLPLRLAAASLPTEALRL